MFTRLRQISLAFLVILSLLGCMLAEVWLNRPRVKITPKAPLELNKSIPFEIEVKSKEPDENAHITLVLSPLDVGTIETSTFDFPIGKNDKKTITTNITFVETGLYQVVALFVTNDERYYAQVTIEMTDSGGWALKEGEKPKLTPQLIPVTIEAIPQ